MTIRKFAAKSTLAALAAVTTLGLGGVAQAQDAPVNNGSVSFGAGFDVVSTYVFRGYELEDSGFIIQPYVEASVSLVDSDDYTLDFYAGTWGSFHSEQTGTGATNDAWYEQDIYAGFAVSMGAVSLDLNYTGYFYPNGNFGEIQEFGVTLGYDDTGMFGDDLSLAPYIFAAFEFDNDNGGTENSYLELGIEPAFVLVDSETSPVDLSIPVALGLSIDDYYADATGDEEEFGFLSIGAYVSTPLTMIPSEYGDWSIGAGVTLYLLNDDVVLTDGGDDDFNVTGSISISMSY